MPHLFAKPEQESLLIVDIYLYCITAIYGCDAVEKLENESNLMRNKGKELLDVESDSI